ncbi:hypothetical protein EHO60_12125 [Leptospira fletcheri]|uniref:Uncharacterized protein n=1 Tax=Leptospira fletcheri TaxID=2484981 RepID=A0A4R9GAY7_9LEPT|nr:hypothetical protein [Leptospira fletcheri]TGK08791.1 hypothetical protein EHO60_12125 [Leptospira fletcheri]
MKALFFRGFLLFTLILAIQCKEKDEQKSEPQNNSTTQQEVKPDKTPVLLKLANPSIKSVYHISYAAPWVKKLKTEGRYGICAEVDPKKKLFKIKFEGEDKIYLINMTLVDESKFSLAYEGVPLYDGIFVDRKKTLGIYMKFSEPGSAIDPFAWGDDEVPSDGYQMDNPIHVKNMSTVIDCEMEILIAGCLESPEQNQPWKDCRPPGYNNLKN